jgi:DNA-binding CsgD family transcriptional regulator
MAQKVWTSEEVDYLLNNYQKKTYRQIGEALGRSIASIESKLRNIKKDFPDLKSRQEILRPGSEIRLWTKEEEQYILENLKDKTNSELAIDLNRTHASVQTKIVQLRKKYPEIKKYERPVDSLNYDDVRLFSPKPIKLTECPDCGSSRINQVENVVDGAAYYCVNCMREYTRYGKPVRPIF